MQVNRLLALFAGGASVAAPDSASTNSALPTVHHKFQRIHRAAKNLLRIIDDTFDFSKLEAGKITIEKIPFSLAERTTAVSEEASERCIGKEVIFLVNLALDLPEVALGDSLRVNQILLNLVENAIKFTELSTVTLNVRKGSEVGRVYFELVDQGIGLNEQHISRLFQTL
jgi:two-component system sensor histidine kinase/response regulator